MKWIKTPGKISWKELMTRDAAVSAAFYRDLFGWVREQVILGRLDLHVFQCW